LPLEQGEAGEGEIDSTEDAFLLSLTVNLLGKILLVGIFSRFIGDSIFRTTASLNENPGIFEASLSFLIFAFFFGKKKELSDLPSLKRADELFHLYTT
jgi:hypothetical protein